MPAQLGERLRLQPCNLQLNIEKRAPGKLPKNIRQRRQRQNFRIRPLYLQSADNRVMADYSLPVGGKPRVKLKTVATLL